MPRRATPLTAQKVARAAPGRHYDGDGLQLMVRDQALAWWVLRYTVGGKTREMGLGRARGPNAISLAAARAAATGFRQSIRQGVDPLAEREASERQKAAEAAAARAEQTTFRHVADMYVAAHEAAWRNGKHRAQWRSTLDTYAFPVMGDRPVAAVATGDVMEVLEPIWRIKPETASRLRGRIESVLDYARARGWREGDNPARWRGHLDNLLPSRAKVARVEHHAALPWGEAGAFMVALRKQQGIGARALEFTILTGARTGETIGATWAEIDLDAAIWTVPGSRMKAGREHRVPLSEPALAVLREMLPARSGPDTVVFPGGTRGKPLSNMAMTAALRRMKRADLTVHGFRSTFRDWCAEATHYPREVAEQALAHTLSDKVEAAYRRGDLFEKRRGLMDEWATHCSGK